MTLTGNPAAPATPYLARRSTRKSSASRRSAPRPRAIVPALAGMVDGGDAACAFLKLFSNRHRLQILSVLAEGEKTVGELEDILGLRQAAMSQHLARLRNEKAVKARRDGKNVYYCIANAKVRTVLDVVHSLFCEDCRSDNACPMRQDCR